MPVLMGILSENAASTAYLPDPRACKRLTKRLEEVVVVHLQQQSWGQSCCSIVSLSERLSYQTWCERTWMASI